MTGDFPQQPIDPGFNLPVQPCPSCGHCPTCGRGPSYPIYYQPYWYTWPNQIVLCSGTSSQGEGVTTTFGPIS